MTRHATVAALLVQAALLVACRQSPQGVQNTTGPALPEPVVPAGYQKIPPAAVDGGASMLAQTATVFRGVLKDVRFTYDDCGGPRTNYVFSDASPLAGTRVDAEVTLKVLGGPTPGGTWVSVSELPTLALDSSYVTFLRNTDWTYSPVVEDLVFRVETIAGREMLVHPSGRAVTGWGDDGPVLSAAAVSDPVGGQRIGFRRPDAAELPQAGTANPNVEAAPADGRTPPDAPPRAGDSLLADAPSLTEIRAAGLFARPAVNIDVVANEPTIAVESFVSSIREAAGRARVEIGGRVALNPYWKCWSSTPTARAR